MAIYSTTVLSGSTNGRPIHVITTTNPGTTIHTVATATAVLEYPYIWAWNQTTATLQINVLFGGTATGNELTLYIPGQAGLYGITNGMALVGATGMTISAYGTGTAGLLVGGYSDRAS